MCGLIGIFIGKRLKAEEHERVKTLFTQVLLANEERGKEATGVAAFRPDGRMEFLKMPIKASDFVKTEKYRSFLKAWDQDVCSLLGHTRKPTKGSPWNYDNNHPIITGETIGIHNGTIKNDDMLFKNEGLKRHAQVDSEVIFSMLDEIDFNTGSKEFVTDIQNCTKKLTGYFTTLSVDRRNPAKLLVLKYNQPISYHYSKSLETLFFSSRYIFLRKAFGHQVVTEALESKMAFVYDLFANSVPKGQPYLHFPIQSANESSDR